MPEIDEEEAEEMLAEDRRHISETLRINISPIHVADESSQPFGFGGTRIDLNALDLDTLVEWRLQHQTQHAALGVRTKVGGATEETNELSMRRQLIRQFHEVLKQEQNRGECTGVNRDIHWCAPALANGNSANAAQSVSAAAAKVSFSY
jgi:hypothetical protein